jgi:hypothetical protein
VGRRTPASNRSDDDKTIRPSGEAANWPFELVRPPRLLDKEACRVLRAGRWCLAGLGSGRIRTASCALLSMSSKPTRLPFGSTSRLRFEHEGRLRARRKHRDIYLDNHMMSRVRSSPGPA